MRTTLVAAVICLGATAQAQHSQYHYPVEPAALESHVDVQLEYAQPGSDPAVHRTVLSVEGQYAIASRLEVGLNVPFLFYTFSSSDAPTSVPLEAQVGDFIVGLKARVRHGERLAAAVFLNTRLPVHSGLGDRNNATFQAGAAATLTLGRGLVGGTLEFLWFLRTVNEDLGTTGRDVAYIGFSVHAAYRLLGPISARMALQFYNSLHPDGGLHLIGLTPGIEIELRRRLTLTLASRIAPTVDSRDLFGGSATVLLSAGWRL